METKTFNDLPVDVMIEIFIRLPAKSLVRNTKVCTYWYKVITSSYFISAHATKTQNESSNSSGPSVLSLSRYYSDFHLRASYTLDNDKFDDGYYGIAGSCNGSLCLLSGRELIVLWNPSIQRWMELPSPSNRSHSSNFVLGFGCDLQGLEYKVVRIVFEKDISKLAALTEVYSLSTKSWRDAAIPPKVHLFPGCSVVNGVLHWLAFDRKCRRLILGFNLKDEIFTEISLPDCLANMQIGSVHINRCACLYLVIYQGRLAVMEHNSYDRNYKVWVIKEYGNVESWEPLIKIAAAYLVKPVFGFKKHGHILTKIDAFPAEHNKAFANYIANFVESLVLLEGHCRFQRPNGVD